MFSSNSDDDLRLVGGAGPHEGRVETYRASTPGWGSICDTSNTWGKEEADVACWQVGYPSGSLNSKGNFGVGGRPAFLRDVDCTGTQEKIQDCSALILTGSSACPNGSEVAVVCDVTIPGKYIIMMAHTAKINDRGKQMFL